MKYRVGDFIMEMVVGKWCQAEIIDIKNDQYSLLFNDGSRADWDIDIIDNGDDIIDKERTFNKEMRDICDND